MTVTLDLYSIVVWAFIGLLAGYLASKLVLGHGMGLLADISVGVVGALAGGFLAHALGVTLNVPGHPVISQIIIAFLGAIILLSLLRVFGLGRIRSFTRRRGLR
jgi:uncharacterized membrane protein YeaQ/YmgE (transglycosylase-associated protein family)